jgi:membrane associated rhomboid family serine protease
MDVTLPRTTARGERSPTVETLALMGGVFLVQFPLSLVGLAGPFALSPAFPAAPWTLVTSVYSHAGPGHLLGNAVLLAVVGLLVERVTTRLRFHAYFVATGATAGLVEVLAPSLTGPTAVLGASGAVFALLGYVVAGNVAADRLGSAVVRATGRAWADTALLAAVAVVVAVATTGPNSALLAHATGLLVGLLAGRGRLLHVGADGGGPTRGVRDRIDG